MAVKFECDENKNRTNMAKHGIEFAAVAPVFEDPLSLTIPDRVAGDERRYRSIGAALNGVVLLVHTLREVSRNDDLIRIIPARYGTQQHRKGRLMKKANSKAQNAEMQIFAAPPDAQIDTSDIPETTDWTGAVRGLFARPETRQISIRLAAADLVTANRLAAAKGLPYQTLIKSLLHEALENESRRLRR